MGRARAAALILLVGLLAACASDDASTSEGTLLASTSPASHAAKLVDRTCDAAPWLPPMQCYFLEVPERRDGAGTKTIKLWVAVVTPEGASPNALPLVWIVGGPGDAASPILDHRLSLGGTPRPLVFVDQRGTGRSEPRLDCKALDDLALNGTQPWADRVERAQAAANGCRDDLVASDIDLDAYNTAEDAADIVDLRKALGYDSWLVYGLSYGGRLAQQVLKVDDGAIAGVILDSSITSVPLGPASLVERAKDASARLAAACTAQPGCAQSSPDPIATQNAAIAQMDAHPYTTTVRNPDGSLLVVSGEEVVSGGFRAQYSRDLIPVLPAAAKSIAAGDTGIIDALAAQLTVPGDHATGLNGTSLCADDGATMSSADLAVLADPGEYGALLLGWPYPMCDAWNVAPVPGGPLTEPTSDVPVLLMEGGLDPVAPPRFADIIKAGLSHATVVVIPSGGHGNAFGGECAARISNAFLDDPSALLDTSCVASLPPPFAP